MHGRELAVLRPGTARTSSSSRASCRTKRPRRMIAACVASASPSVRLCVTSSSAAPASRRSVSASVSAALPASSSPVYGSSQRRSRGECTIARAIDTRCWSPRLSVRTGVSARSSTRMSASACARRLGRIGQAVQSRRELDVLARGEHAVEHARVAHEPDLRARRRALLHRDAVHPHRSLPGAPAGRRAFGAASSSPLRSGRTARGSRRASRVKLTPSTARRPPKVRTSPSAWTTGLFSAVEETALEWAGAEGDIRGRYRRAARRERAELRLPDPLDSGKLASEVRKSTARNCFRNPADLSERIPASKWPSRLPYGGAGHRSFTVTSFASGWPCAFFGTAGPAVDARRRASMGRPASTKSSAPARCAQLVRVKERWPPQPHAA